MKGCEVSHQASVTGKGGTIKFLINYWLGNYTLKFSFWVVFLGLLVTLSFFEPLLISTFSDDPQQRIYASFLSLIITRLIIYPWQLVGLIRAVDKDFIAVRKNLRSVAVQATILLSLLFTLSYSIDVLQSAYAYDRSVSLSKNTRIEPPSYSLTFAVDTQQLHIQGNFDVGITKAVTAMVERNTINSVLLESHGGQIYEGRGLSKLFSKNNIDTYVENYCSSACTSAFVGGQKRYLGKNAKLGFHQYKLDRSIHKKVVPYHNPQEQQQRDLDLFRSRGISSEFLEKMFVKKPNQMWFPSHAELLEASIIHKANE